MWVVNFLRTMWIPLVVFLMIGCGGFSVSWLHSFFGSDKRASYADAQIEDTKLINPKQVIHEVIGSAGTVADISYFDVNTEPRHIIACQVMGV